MEVQDLESRAKDLVYRAVKEGQYIGLSLYPSRVCGMICEVDRGGREKRISRWRERSGSRINHQYGDKRQVTSILSPRTQAASDTNTFRDVKLSGTELINHSTNATRSDRPN